jgi:hypothetical protein
MKAFFKAIILFLFTVTFVIRSNSQTTVSLDMVVNTDSYFCPTPYLYPAGVAVEVYGYDPTTDSIDVYIDWNDGTDTIVRTNIITANDVFSYTLYHSYTTPGSYNLKGIASGPDGTADTVNIPTFIIAGSCSGVGIIEYGRKISSHIYPNPSAEQFSVSFEEELNGLLSVWDMNGLLVKTIVLSNSKEIIIKSGDLSPGLYGFSMPGFILEQSRILILK